MLGFVNWRIVIFWEKLFRSFPKIQLFLIPPFLETLFKFVRLLRFYFLSFLCIYCPFFFLFSLAYFSLLLSSSLFLSLTISNLLFNLFVRCVPDFDYGRYLHLSRHFDELTQAGWVINNKKKYIHKQTSRRTACGSPLPLGVPSAVLELGIPRQRGHKLGVWRGLLCGRELSSHCALMRWQGRGSSLERRWSGHWCRPEVPPCTWPPPGGPASWRRHLGTCIWRSTFSSQQWFSVLEFPVVSFSNDECHL